MNQNNVTKQTIFETKINLSKLLYIFDINEKNS